MGKFASRLGVGYLASDWLSKSPEKNLIARNEVMTAAILDSVFVLLTDWRGHVVWTSATVTEAKIGSFSWVNLTAESQERSKAAHSKVASLREIQALRVENLQGKFFQCWLWPLDSPEIAVCVLGREVPAELSQLSDREVECLELLAQGIETKEIAEKLDVSLSTVHTHLKRSREKLDLPGVEALIAFAARYCYPQAIPFAKCAEK